MKKVELKVPYGNNNVEEKKVETAVEDETEEQKAAREEKERAEKEKKEKANTITCVTPMSLSIVEKTHNRSSFKIASVTFLCINALDEFFTISRNYVVDSPEEEEALSLLDLHMDSMGTNVKICVKQIINHCPCYVSEFKYKADDPTDKKITLECVESKSGDFRSFKTNLDVFIALKFIEDMIYKCEVDNEVFFSIATVIASKAVEDTEFFIVDKIESVMAITSGVRAPIERFAAIKEVFRNKPTEQLAIVVKVSGIVADDIREKKENPAPTIYQVSIPFTSDIAYKKDKFKGMTIENMEKIYYGQEDQYSTTLSIKDIELFDKRCNIYRVKNTKGDAKIFVFNHAMLNDIQQKIVDF